MQIDFDPSSPAGQAARKEALDLIAGMIGVRHLDDLLQPTRAFAVVKDAFNQKTMAELTHLAYALGRVASLALRGWADATAEEPEEVPVTAEELLWRFDQVLIGSGDDVADHSAGSL